tara:strand:+ start:262 stop:399 length:138 start_codon:yes stop_codon:yes gene_type:complete
MEKISESQQNTEQEVIYQQPSEDNILKVTLKESQKIETHKQNFNI